MRTYGIERERFIVDERGVIVPKIGILLPLVHAAARAQGLSEERFTFELFAGQIEDRTPPCRDHAELEDAMRVNDCVLAAVAQECGLAYDASEYVTQGRVAAFEVNPFDARHQGIWASIPSDRRVAASSVAAVHVHLSVNQEEAVRVLNLCRADVIEGLVRLGDHSGGERVRSYRAMAGTEGIPPQFHDFAAVMSYIASKGGEKNVWDLVRYKPSTGTVEFRMFGATSDLRKVLGYVRACQDAAHL